MRCLITGGGGFLGYHLTHSLLERGYSVICLDIQRPQWLENLPVEFVKGDFSATHLTTDILERCDVVYHMACTTLPQTSNNDPDFDVSSNVLGAVRMLEHAVKTGVKKFIFVSSGGTVYGVPSVLPIPETHPTNPTCSYGITKLTIEKYLRLYSSLHGLQTCSIRLANPFGEFQNVKSLQGAIAVFCYKVLTGEPIEIWGDGSVRRDFIYVSDVVDSFIKVLDCDKTGFEVNIGSGKSSSINEILELIQSISGKKLIKNYKAGRDFDIPVSMLDISLAKQELGWEPKVSLEQGLERTINWLKTHYLL
jgi:UDP-glucose 4-epimerase